VCIKTYQPDTKSNPNPNPNPNFTNKQHTIVNIQLNISHVLYPDKCKKLKSLKQCLTATRPTSHN